MLYAKCQSLPKSFCGILLKILSLDLELTIGIILVFAREKKREMNQGEIIHLYPEQAHSLKKYGRFYS